MSARRCRRSIRWLFVDEFQDTDPVQAEIVFLLAAEELSRVSGVLTAEASTKAVTRMDRTNHADWRSVSLRPGALFVVGDPKQSIYRFRRADIEIYNLVRARIAESTNGAVVPLTTNFRSTGRAVRLGQQRVQVPVPISRHGGVAAVRAVGTSARRTRRHRPASARREEA